MNCIIGMHIHGIIRIPTCYYSTLVQRIFRKGLQECTHMNRIIEMHTNGIIRIPSFITTPLSYNEYFENRRIHERYHNNVHI